MGLTKEEFLEFKRQGHEEGMKSVTKEEEELLKIPYIDNIPL